MDFIQYNRQDFLNIKESYQVSEETYDNYDEIINIINSQLFQNNKYNGNKSGKDWRKKKLPSFLDRQLSDDDKLKNSINLELNKLSVENYRSIFVSIKKILSTISNDKYTDILLLVIDSVFEKAVIQPDYCPYYVKLVFSLVDNDNKALVMTLLRNKCTIYHQILTKKIDGNTIDQVSSIKNNQKDEDGNNHNDKHKNNENLNEELNQELNEGLNQELNEELNENINDKLNENLNNSQAEYDEICKLNMRKQYKKGFSQFVGELYNYDIISTREVLFFYKKMISNIIDEINRTELDEDFIEDNITYFQKLLEVTIQRLVSKQYKNINIIYQISRNIDEIINHKNITILQSRLKFILKDCHDMLKYNLKNIKKH
jgi:hypothetical protein